MNSITGVRAMLAANTPWDEKKVLAHLKKDGYLIMQPKWDGMRCLFDGRDGRAMSRSWKPLGSKYLQMFANDFGPMLHGIDSEVFPGHDYDPTSFRAAMSKIRAEEGSREFTVVAYDNWSLRGSYHTRQQLVCAALSELGTVFGNSAAGYRARVIFTESRVVKTLDEIYAYEEELLAEGHEGGILRRAGTMYKYGRATFSKGELLKLKRWVDDEAVVIGYEPRYVNNNEPTRDARGYQVRSAHQENLEPIDQLGVLKVSKRNSDGTSTEFGIGSFLGWDHDYLRQLWTIRDTLPGRIVKYKHQGYGGGYDKPRQPIGLGWRDPADMG